MLLGFLMNHALGAILRVSWDPTDEIENFLMIGPLFNCCSSHHLYLVCNELSIIQVVFSPLEWLFNVGKCGIFFSSLAGFYTLCQPYPGIIYVETWYASVWFTSNCNQSKFAPSGKIFDCYNAPKICLLRCSWSQGVIWRGKMPFRWLPIHSLYRQEDYQLVIWVENLEEIVRTIKGEPWRQIMTG